MKLRSLRHLQNTRAPSGGPTYPTPPYPTIVMAAASYYGWALYHAAEPFKADREIVMAAVSNNGWALYHAAEPLWVDKDNILAALFSPSITRGDTRMFDDELDECFEIIQFISKDLYGDEEITSRLIDLYGDDLPLAFLYSFVQKYLDRLVLYSSTPCMNI